MRLADFSFVLPQQLIAQRPRPDRHSSRLLVCDRATSQLQHQRFFDIVDWLRPGDVVVINNSKVLPARLIGRKAVSGGGVEVLLLRRLTHHTAGEVWEVLLKNKKTTPGLVVNFFTGTGQLVLQGSVVAGASDHTWLMDFSVRGSDFRRLLEDIGQTPTPPYIAHGMTEQAVRAAYQTVFATQDGSVAAPTAGLHFSENLLAAVRDRGVTLAPITLHVGLGTFAPVQVDDITKHKMHSELAAVPPATADIVNQAKADGRRIIAVGTTSVRTLEACMHNGRLHSGTRATDIFITPGYQFQCIDGMITNFHLPKSTLLMLVSAFAGTEFVRRAYAEAIAQHYRFYSFGDAMLLV